MEPKREDVDRGIFSNSNNTPYRKDISSPALPPTIFHKKVFNRKGQVTIFIIVGIIILAAAAAIFFISSSTVRERLTTEGEPVIAQVPVEFAPLKDFTDNCLLDVSKRGLLILGEQGGYIYPELVGQYSAGNPTDADGIDLEPLKVPYWHYNKEPNAGNKISFASLQPKLYASEDKEMSIESQLGRFVNEKLDSCLQGYTAFKGQGYEVEVLSLPSATARVTDNFVQFSLQMDVDAARGDAKHSFEEFFVKVPLKLKKYYEVAERIVKAEQNYSFLERQGLDLIEIYSGVDVNKLPPTTDLTFDLAPSTFWNEVVVKGQYQELLTSYVPMLRFLGSENFYRYQYPVSDLSGLYQKNYDNMILPLVGAEGLTINFDYFNWPLFFGVNSRDGSIEPQSLVTNLNILHFGIQRYNTVYDVSYPVLVTLRDSEALDGQGYTFLLAVESNIRNNGPAKKDEILPELAASFSESMVCDRNKWETGLLKSIVVDTSSSEPLEAVQVGLSIPENDHCPIGTSNTKGEVDSIYPAIYGGVITFIKEGYLTTFYPLDTYPLKGKSAIIGYALANYPQEAIPLHQFKPITVSVKKKNIEKCIDDRCYFSDLFGATEEVSRFSPKLLDSTHKWVYTGVTKPLEPNERAIITFNRIKDLTAGVYNDPYSAVATVSGEGTQQIEFVPGVYEVTANVLANDEVIIPEEKRCTSVLLGLVEDSCFTIEETRMSSFMSGQVLWDEPQYYLTITPEELYSSSVLQVNVPVVNLDKVPLQEHKRVIEDLQVIAELGKISKELRQALQPIFS